jgi:hypothetical protein
MTTIQYIQQAFDYVQYAHIIVRRKVSRRMQNTRGRSTDMSALPSLWMWVDNNRTAILTVLTTSTTLDYTDHTDYTNYTDYTAFTGYTDHTDRTDYTDHLPH